MAKVCLKKIECYTNVDIKRGPWSIFWIGGAIVVPAQCELIGTNLSLRVLGPPLRGEPPFVCSSVSLSQNRKTADRVSWGMLPQQILKSRTSKITENAFQSKEKFVKFLNTKIKINNNDNNKLFLVGLQPTQPHSSAVPILKAQNGNEKVPLEPHLAVRQDQAGRMLFDIDS